MKKMLYFSFFIFHFSFIHAQTVIHYSYEPAVQHFYIPPGVGTITVTIGGAHGAGALGGNGASFTGICNVISPHVLSIAVGQEGVAVADTGNFSGGAGGGASWVYDSNVVLYNPIDNIGLIAVAAGGGGAGSFAYYSVPFQGWQYYAGGDGGIDLSTNAATVGTYSDPGGIGGNGGDNGGGNQYFIYAAGGAGWHSNGMGGACVLGMDEANHFGNLVVGCDIHGAFGGGGFSQKYNEAGNDGTNGSGGGGYNGGAAGYGGGGGGSYLNGTLVGTATASDTGNGFVTISYIPALSQVIDIYPNPNSGVFTVNGIRQEQLIEIYNCLGQKLQMLQASDTFLQVDLSAYSNGVYIVVVRNADGSKVEQTKVVKF